MQQKKLYQHTGKLKPKQYDTRNADNFDLSAHRTTLFNKKPYLAGAKLLNMLPQDITHADLTLEDTSGLATGQHNLYTPEEF